MPNRYLDTVTTETAASLLSASRTSVQRWIDSGMLKAFKTPGGHRRITRNELAAFLRRQGAPIPVGLRTRPRVLLLDTQRSDARSLKEELRLMDADVEVIACQSVVEGLLHLGSGESDVGLVSTALPGLDVASLADRLRRAPGEPLPLFALLPKDDAHAEARLRHAGVAGVLVKPLRAAALLDALRQAELLP